MLFKNFKKLELGIECTIEQSDSILDILESA